MILFALSFSITLIAITYCIVKYNFGFEYLKYFISLSSGIGIAYFTAITVDSINNRIEYENKIQVILSYPYFLISICLLVIMYSIYKKG